MIINYFNKKFELKQNHTFAEGYTASLDYIFNIYEWFIFGSVNFETLFDNNKKLVDFPEIEEKLILNIKSDFLHKTFRNHLLNSNFEKINRAQNSHLQLKNRVNSYIFKVL